MTVEDVRKALRQVEAITQLPYGNEHAHRAEDGLYIAVLEYVVNCPDSTPLPHLREIAAEVLKARHIDYDRWYA